MRVHMSLNVCGGGARGGIKRAEERKCRSQQIREGKKRRRMKRGENQATSHNPAACVQHRRRDSEEGIKERERNREKSGTTSSVLSVCACICALRIEEKEEAFDHEDAPPNPLSPRPLPPP